MTEYITVKEGKSERRIKPITLTFPFDLYEYMEQMITDGYFVNFSELVRHACNRLVEIYYYNDTGELIEGKTFLGLTNPKSVCLPKLLLKNINQLVKDGYFENRSEVIRYACYRLIKIYYEDE